MTEILDVAPIDLIAALSKKNIGLIPEFLLTDKMRDQLLDVELHWVTETGKDGKLTSGAMVKATVSFLLTADHDSSY